MFSSIRKRLRSWLGLSVRFNDKPEANIPDAFELDEKIGREIFSPINLHRKSQKLLSNAFKPPADLDEISVNRIDYAGLDFFKNLGVKHQSEGRMFYGIAVLTVDKIKLANSRIVYSPIMEPSDRYNPYHADIKIDFKVVKGEQLPSEIQYKVDQLKDSVTLYIDPDPLSHKWQGKPIL